MNQYNKPSEYGSVHDNANLKPNNLWLKSRGEKSRACYRQIIFIGILISILIVCIIISVYPIHKRLPKKLQEVDPTTCQTHICLYEMTDIELTNTQISLLQHHPSTIAHGSKFAYINQEKFELSKSELTVTHPEGMVMSLPLISYTNNGLYYFQDDMEDRFLISMNSESDKVEGYASCQGVKYELHSIDDLQFYLLIEKDWVQDTTNWCGVFDINTKYDAIELDDDFTSDDTAQDIIYGDINNQDMAMWVTADKMFTNHIELDGLLTTKDITSNGFIVEPLCSSISPFDGNIYCLLPSDDNPWQQFEDLTFYQYDVVNSLWTEMTDVPLDLADSTINIPKSMCVVTDNEIYAFSVNPVDAMINVYSYTTSWRLHHYTPVIGGDIDKVEIKSVYINDVLYFSINEYEPIGQFTIYHYTDDIFSVYDDHNKIGLPVYSHCLSEYNDALVTFYVDYGHNLHAYYDDYAYDLEFNLAAEIDTNQFDCIWTKMGHVLSWKYDSNVYQLQLSPDNIQQIMFYGKLPWNMELSEANLFQLISLKNSINAYKSVSVYYSNDVMNNYLLDVESIAMDISSIITLSNILYDVNNKYENMMRLENVLMYDDDLDIDSFTSYEGQSNINILLVDTMSDDEEVGYMQCNVDQSFAVVQYSAF